MFSLDFLYESALIDRNLTTGDITQQYIKNGINLLILNIQDKDAIKKAFSAIVPDGWFDWKKKPKDVPDILKQLTEIPQSKSNNSALLEFIFLLIQDKNISLDTRDKLKKLLNNKSFKRLFIK